MKKHLSILAALMFGLTLTGTAFAQNEGPEFPVIKDYGPVYRIPHAAEMPYQKQNIKTLFDLTKGAKDPAKVNPGLDHIARYLNVYALAGVKPQNMHLVAILHGKATAAVLTNQGYDHYMHTQSGNPNLKLLDALHKAGVTLYVCGQALHDFKYPASDVVPEVKRTLSALVVVTNYQEKHYAYFPM